MINHKAPVAHSKEPKAGYCLALLVAASVPSCKTISESSIRKPPLAAPATPLPRIPETTLSLATTGSDHSIDKKGFHGKISFSQDEAHPTVTYSLCDKDNPKNCYSGTSAVFKTPLPGRSQSPVSTPLSGVACFVLKDLAKAFRLKTEFIAAAIEATPLQSAQVNQDPSTLPDNLVVCWTDGEGSYWSWSMLLER